MKLSQKLDYAYHTYDRLCVRGKKIYMGVWFSALYLMLLTMTVGFFYTGDYLRGERRLSLAIFVGALTITATSVLTKMLLGWRAEIRQLAAKE